MAFISAVLRSPKWVLGALAVLVAMGASQAILRVRQTDTVLVAFIGSLSGHNAHTGNQCVDGALLAIEDCNEKGGIDGAQVRLEIFDDRHDPAAAAEIMETLVQREPWAVIGPTCRNVAPKVAASAAKHHLLLVSPMISTDATKKPLDSLASVRPSFAVAADNIARHLRYKRQLLRVAIVTSSDCGEYVEGAEDKLKLAFTAAGMACTGVFKLEGRGGDLSQIAKQIGSSDAEAVIILAGGVETAIFTQRLRASGCTLPAITYEPASMQDLITYGGASAEGITVISSIAPHSESARYKGFRERFEKRFGRSPDVAEIHSYEATHLALLSVAQAPSSEDVRRIMLSRQWFDGLQGRISIGSSGSARRELRATKLRDGVFTVFE